MKEEYLAAVDVGTTGLRTMLFDEEGNVEGRSYSEYLSDYPNPGWVEQDPNKWWEALCTCTPNAIERAGIDPKDIRAIAITNQRETIVPVDRNLEPLRKAIVWQDTRAGVDRWCPKVPGEESNIVEWIKSEDNIGEEYLYEHTGLIADPYFSASKILWIKWHQPEIFNQTDCFLTTSGYILSKLSGVLCDDWTNLSRTMLFDIIENDYNKYILDRMGISREKLPKPLPSANRIGEIEPDLADETGFAEGTQIVTGGGDQQCGALGVGVTEPGKVESTTGTGTFTLAYSERPNLDEKFPPRILCSEHVVEGSHVNECSHFTTGSVYRWVRDNLCKMEKQSADRFEIDPYEIMNKEAESSRVGANGLLCIPHFMGAGTPFWNPSSRGIFLGLDLDTSKADILRSVLEGIAFCIRSGIEAMQDSGLEFDELRITGGLTRSRLFNQIQADVYDLPVYRGISDATSLGAAICAGVGGGVYEDIKNGVERTVKIKSTWEPRDEKVTQYDRLYEIWDRTYSVLERENVYKGLQSCSRE